MKKILLVEDTQHLAEEIADILAMEGFEVQVAINGVQGLELFHNDRFDIIVTDLLMPGMDGFELIRQVRSEAESIPIIVLSAKSSEADRAQAREIGADGFVPKPCKAHELLKSINSLLESPSSR